MFNEQKRAPPLESVRALSMQALVFGAGFPVGVVRDMTDDELHFWMCMYSTWHRSSSSTKPRPSPGIPK